MKIDNIPQELVQVQKNIFDLNPKKKKPQQSRTQTQTSLTRSQTDINKKNEIYVSKIISDCKDIPFWIPDENRYYDFDIKEIVTRLDAADSSEEVDHIIKELAERDYQKHKEEYDRHERIFNETLDQSYKDWIEGRLPHPSFIRPKCCFNHYIGLPTKDLQGKLKIFDFEMYLVYLFQKLKRIDILKSRGLGITEIVLRYLLWRILKDRKWAFRMGAIITGLRLDPAVKLIKRMKTFLTRTFPIEFDIRQTEFIMNDVTVQAFPSKNSANTLRSYEDFCFCIIDEADFFKLSDQVEVKHAAEGYFLKSQPLMIWISTPNKPSGVMENFRTQYIERINSISDKDGNEFHIPLSNILHDIKDSDYFFDYFHVELPYQVGLGKTYVPSFVAKEKLKDYFPREYMLQFGYGIGNLFKESDIKKCFIHEYSPFEYLSNTYKVMTIDYGLGSSKTGIMVSEFIPYPDQFGITDLYNARQPFLIRVLYADEFERPNPTQIENVIDTLIKEYQIFQGKRIGKIGIDGANITLIKKVKEMIGEDVEYDKVYENLRTEQRQPFLNQMRVMPINFAKFQRQMLFTLHDYVTKGFYAINMHQFGNILGQMRVAQADDKGLIKEKGGLTFDIFDCLRMDAYVHSLIP